MTPVPTKEANSTQGNDAFPGTGGAPGRTHPGISIFGLGYVGAVSAACFTRMRYPVIGVDPDTRKVDLINQGRVPIVEPDLPEMLRAAMDAGLLRATSSVTQAVQETAISLVSVATPSGPDGSCNTAHLQEASRQIGESLRTKDEYHLIVYRSTVPPGTTRDSMIPILEQASGRKCGQDFGVCFNPEFLREGNAVRDFFAPPRTVIGESDRRSGALAASLYEGQVEGELICTSIEVAELVKYTDNAWHALKVVFGNEIGRISKALGIDGQEVMSIMTRDKKLNLSPCYLKPGFAFGGSCLPKDTRGINSLARSLKVEAPVLGGILQSNECHFRHAENLITSLPGERIGFLGVTFKAGTDDIRESPGIELVKRLFTKGYEVRIYDPNFPPRKAGDPAEAQTRARRIVDRLAQFAYSSPLAMIDASDILVVTHNDPSFVKILDQVRGRIPIIDLVGVIRDLGHNETYHGICW